MGGAPTPASTRSAWRRTAPVSQYAYDRVKQRMYMHTDRGQALREAILACRKGGTLSILGVYGVMDKFPIGAIMNKGLTVRTAQQHGQAYMPRLLDHAQKGELDPSFLATHRFSLEDARVATPCSSTRRTVASALCSSPETGAITIAKFKALELSVIQDAAPDLVMCPEYAMDELSLSSIDEEVGRALCRGRPIRQRL